MAVASGVPIVLVTGASGFIGARIVKELLIKGDCIVRGSVRNTKNEEKVKPLVDLVQDPVHPLELVEAELSNPDSWKEAVKDCTYVYHVASPLMLRLPSDENVLIRPAVEGTLNVLQACVEAGTVKRVVLTSSIAAVSGGFIGVTGYTYTEKDWSDPDVLPPYEKSKTLAEKAAWDFMEKLEDDKKFELVAVNPAVVLGPPLLPGHGSSASLGFIKGLLTGEMSALMNLNVPFIDVRDVVAGHIAAMEKPEAAGKRILLTGGNYWFREIAEVISKEFTPQGYKIASRTMPNALVFVLKFFVKDLSMFYPMLGKVMTFDNGRMVSELDITPMSLDETLIDSCYGLIEKGIVPKTEQYKSRPTPSN